MAPILRAKIRWQVPTGGTGYSVFHFRDFDSGVATQAHADGAVQRLDSFITDILTLIPSSVQLQTVGEVEVLEEANGELTGFLSSPTNAPKMGTAGPGSFWAAAQGAVITWRTGGVRNGRRIRGRTFIVPTSGGAFDVDGTLNASAVTTLTAAATSLGMNVGTPDLGIWARPSAPGANDGQWTSVNGFTVPDVGAILRSRRD